MENSQVERFNKIFEQAAKRLDDLIFLDGYHRKTLNSSGRKKLEKAIKEFQECLEIVPDHWQSMFLMAKTYQRLENHAEALELLEKAFMLEVENHSIPMEASLEAMHMENIDKALYYSEESLKRKPNDFALMGNHAMNLLVACKDDEAKKTIEQAISLEPDDSVNKNVKSIINDVISGKRKRPTFQDAIK